MMTPEELAARIGIDESLDFEHSIAVIDTHFEYTPCAFRNGEQSNAAGENGGSCKILAFGRLLGLSEQQTLNCFGRFYRDVLATPDGTDHANIRNFIRHGWSGVCFEGEPLKRI